MEKTAILKAKDITPAAREWLKDVLHVDLAEGDEFTVTLRRSVRVPTPEERNAARADLLQVLKKMDEKTQQVPDEEMEVAIEEAVRQTRSSRK